MSKAALYERAQWFESQVRASMYPNASSLAEKFGISRKTAQRDIKAMQRQLHCPLEYEPQRKGYFYTKPTFALPRIRLSLNELTALVVARKLLTDINGDNLSGEIDSVIEKIGEIIDTRLFAPRHIDEAVSFRTVEHIPVSEEIVSTVLEGCLNKQRIRFDYTSLNGCETKDRPVDPYHVVNYMGTWHLIGHCHLRDDLRDFNLARMQRVILLERYFEIKPTFDLRKHLDSAFGIYLGGDPVEVVLKFTPDGARRVDGRVWHKDQHVCRLDDGSLELTFPVAYFDEVVMHVLRQGSSVVVVRPEELRTLIKEQARQILSLYP